MVRSRGECEEKVLAFVMLFSYLRGRSIRYRLLCLKRNFESQYHADARHPGIIKLFSIIVGRAMNMPSVLRCPACASDCPLQLHTLIQSRQSVRSALSVIMREIYNFGMMYLLSLALCVDTISPYRFLDACAKRSLMILSNDKVCKRISPKSMIGQRYL